jgi:hypothetical protein
MSRTPETPARRVLALAVAVFVMIGTLAAVAGSASATFSVRKYSVDLEAPSCVAVGERSTFVATFTNSPHSNRPLGSAKIDSHDDPSFSGVADIAITAAPAGKSWSAAPDHSNPDGVLLKATTSGSALSPGESVTVTFSAIAPSPPGQKTWKTFAWERTNFSWSFRQPSSFPKVIVVDSCEGPLDHFVVEAGSPQTAGVAFPVTITAKDASGETVTSFSGSQSIAFTGPGNSPDGSMPEYPVTVTFTEGVGIADVTLKKAETTSLTATQGEASGTSNDITVVPGPPASLVFTGQPTDTPAGGAIASQGGGPVEVKVEDEFGNGVSGATVSMALGTGANGATLSGDLEQDTGPGGFAAFGDLSIDEPGEYSLVATAGSVAETSDSDLFEIVGQLCQEDVDCSASFTGNGGLSSTTITMNQFNPGGDTDEGILLARFDTEELLDCSYLGGEPYDEFTDFTSIYEYSNDERTATIKTVVKKQLFNQVANNGASKLEVCFQAKLPFLLEDGKTFVDMDGDMTAPGLLPGCNKVNSSLYPCISKQKKQGGDAVVIYKVPGRFNVDPRGRS